MYLHFFSFYSFICKLGVKGVNIYRKSLILLAFFVYTILYTMQKIGVKGVT